VSEDLTAVSWNIHRARGKDGRVDPARVLTVLGDEVCPPGTADILALQEADEERRPHRGILDIAGVEAATGLGWAHRDPDLRWSAESHGFLGAILFLPTGATIRHGDLIDLPGRCHRGAVSLEIGLAGREMRVVTTHLSLGQPLRLAQMRTIGQYLMRRPRMQTILLGDLNEWRPWGGFALSPGVTLLRLEGPARPSFPATRPFLPLDRVLSAPGCVRALEVLDGPGIRAASDHRPVRARVRLEV